MADRNIVQELRLLGSLDCPYGCDEIGNPAADAIEELTVERDASRLIISDLAAEVERLRAAGDALAVRHRKTFGLDGAFDTELRQWEAARRER